MSIRQRNAHFTDWAAVCRALNVATESEARTALESSDNTFYYYVCYIKSTKEIYTHGQFYDCSGSSDELLNLINELTAEVSENEEVTARALSDLNVNKASRGEIPTKVSQLTNDADYVTENELSNISNNKQDKLISGTNLKTIEGQTLLGYGDISVCIQSDWNTTDSNSKSYIKNKPIIPSAVTESTVEGWGFTKNSGTYTKPSNGIPKTDLASSVQTSLNKADSALQSIPSEYVTETELTNKGYATTSQVNAKQDIISDLETIRAGAALGATALQTEQYTGTYTKPNTGIPKTDLDNEVQLSLNKIDAAVSSITINGVTKTPTDGTVDLGIVLTSYTPMTLNTAATSPLNLRWYPNQKYAYTSVTAGSGTLVFTMDLNSINVQKDNTWCLSFITGSTVPTISFGVSQTGYTIMWANGVAPTFELNTFYEITFKLVGTCLLGVCGAFKAV